MKALAEETGKVAKKLTEITENSANEGEIVRVITIVSAIYLPGSFVTVSACLDHFIIHDRILRIFLLELT